MKRSILKKIIKEEILKDNLNQSLDRDTIINAYKEAYKSETGNDLDITNFTYFSHTPSNTQTQTIEISKLVSNGEELGDVTLINNGSGWEFGGSIKLSEGFEEDNISLADLEEFGYEEGEKVFEKLESGGLFQNRHDFNAYKKGFMQGFIDSASAYNLNENVTGFSFSREEVENAANTLAQAISKTDDIETYVHDFEYDENRGGNTRRKHG